MVEASRFLIFHPKDMKAHGSWVHRDVTTPCTPLSFIPSRLDPLAIILRERLWLMMEDCITVNITCSPQHRASPRYLLRPLKCEIPKYLFSEKIRDLLSLLILLSLRLTRPTLYHSLRVGQSMAQAKSLNYPWWRKAFIVCSMILKIAQSDD